MEIIDEHKKTRRRRPMLQVTVDAAIRARLEDLAAKSGMHLSHVVERCISLGITAFEKQYIQPQTSPSSQSDESLEKKFMRRVLLSDEGWTPA